MESLNESLETLRYQSGLSHSILHLFDRYSVIMLIVSYIESATQRLCKNLMKDPDKVLSGL